MMARMRDVMFILATVRVAAHVSTRGDQGFDRILTSKSEAWRFMEIARETVHILTHVPGAKSTWADEMVG